MMLSRIFQQTLFSRNSVIAQTCNEQPMFSVFGRLGLEHLNSIALITVEATLVLLWARSIIKGFTSLPVTNPATPYRASTQLFGNSISQTVSFVAMCLLGLFSHRAFATQNIFSSRNGFQMNRIYASPIATKVVCLQVGRHWLYEQVAHYALGVIAFALNTHSAITKSVRGSCPIPARFAIKLVCGGNGNLGKNVSENFSVENDRINVRHFSLQNRLICLGFQGCSTQS